MLEILATIILAVIGLWLICLVLGALGVTLYGVLSLLGDDKPKVTPPAPQPFAPGQRRMAHNPADDFGAEWEC